MSDKAPSPDTPPVDEETEKQQISVQEWRQDIVDCFAFFTRIPVPNFFGPVTDGMPNLQKSSRALPLVGLILAVFAMIPATLFDFFALTAPLPNFVLAAITVALMIIITGGLHEDGLADVADGFWGGHTISRKLEIMKDSRLGSYGALALMLSVLLRVSILSYLFEHYGVKAGGLAFLAAAMASRAPILHVWHTLPAARLNGLSATLGHPSKQAYTTGVISSAVVAVLLVAPVFGSLSVLSALGMTFGCSLLVSRVSMHHIKGQTGDVLGASQQLGEIAFGVGLLWFASAG